MQFQRKNIRIFILLFLSVYFYLGYTSIINRHTHFFPNGIIITHSHPFDKGKDSNKSANQHNHSSTEIHLFQNLPFDKVIIPSTITVNCNSFEISNEYFPLIENLVTESPISEIPPRSPPV